MLQPRVLLVGVPIAVLLVAGCGSSGGNSGASPTSPTTAAAQPVFGNEPSVSAKMICATEAQEEIAGSLGVKPTTPLAPAWKNHIYSCDYVYPNGSMRLSVRELPTNAEAMQYFNQLGKQMGRKSAGTQLGQGTFATPNDSMVVVKDNKVLVVDASKLPANFGSPPQSRADTALTVAVTVMGCWTGA